MIDPLGYGVRIPCIKQQRQIRRDSKEKLSTKKDPIGGCSRRGIHQEEVSIFRELTNLSVHCYGYSMVQKANIV